MAADSNAELMTAYLDDALEAGDAASFERMLEENRIPFYLFPERGIRVLSHMWEYARMQTGFS